jgi:hypothetical protein
LANLPPLSLLRVPMTELTTAPCQAPLALDISAKGAVAADPAALRKPCPNLPPCSLESVLPARPWLTVFTRYAYSAAADRQAAELVRYRQQWVALEARF